MEEEEEEEEEERGQGQFKFSFVKPKVRCEEDWLASAAISCSRLVKAWKIAPIQFQRGGGGGED